LAVPALLLLVLAVVVLLLLPALSWCPGLGCLGGGD
jgi:hypothetical protein